jgi:hypothetical protein
VGSLRQNPHYTPLTSLDDIEGDVDGVFQFGDRLIEVQPLLGSEALGEHDDHVPLQTDGFHRLHDTPSFQNVNQFLGALTVEILSRPTGQCVSMGLDQDAGD